MKRSRRSFFKRLAVLMLSAALLWDNAAFAAPAIPGDSASSEETAGELTAAETDAVEDPLSGDEASGDLTEPDERETEGTEASADGIPEDVSGEDAAAEEGFEVFVSEEFTNERAYGESYPGAERLEGTADEVQDPDYYHQYYNQLDTYGKKLYDALSENYENFKDPAYTMDIHVGAKDPASIDADSWWDALAAFNYDKQEAFWFNEAAVSFVVSRVTENDVIKDVIYTFKLNSKYPDFLTEIYEGDWGKAEADKAELEETANAIAAKTVSCDGLYAKLKVINDELANTNYYNRYVSRKKDAGVDVSKAHTPAGALTVQPWLESPTDLGSNMAPVCESYSKAFKYICDKIGVPCLCVTGAGHMWNYVENESNGKWYAVDVTWDDPVRENEWRDRTTPEQWIDAYLMVGSNSVVEGATFISKHSPTGSYWVGGHVFDVPDLQTEKYNPHLYTVNFVTGVQGLNVPAQDIPKDGYLEEPEVSREGYSLEGWYTSETFEDSSRWEFSRTVTGSMTLHAHWIAKKYTVSFDAAGGTVSPTEKEVTFDAAYGELPEPERDGYAFKWWSLCNPKIKVTDTTIVTTAAGHTLTAVWSQILPSPSMNVCQYDGREIEEGDIPADARISLYDGVPGVTIYYTTDDTDPTVSVTAKKYTSELSAEDIAVSGNIILKAVAKKDGYADSPVATFTLTLLDESDDWGDVGDTEAGSVSDDRALYPDATKVPGYLWIAGIPAETEDKGSAITFNDFRVYYGKKLLKKGTDYTVSYKNNKAIYELKQSDEGFKASKAPTVIVKGKGAYSGTVTRYFCIVPNAADKTPAGYLKVSYKKKTYKLGSEGEGVTLDALTVKDGATVLTSYDEDPSNYDYKVTYTGSDGIEGDSVSCTGKAVCTLDFSDSTAYTGTRTITFTVKGKSLAGVERTWAPFEKEELPLVYGEFDYEANGSRMTFTDGEDELSEGSDYKVSTVLSGLKVTVTYTGIGRYDGSVKKSFKLKAATLTADSVDMAESVPYCKGGAKPEVVVNGAYGELKAGRDYTISYKNCTKVYEITEDNEDEFKPSKAPKAIIKGKGKYRGTVTRYYTITPDADISKATITVSDKVYKKRLKNWTPVMTITDGGKKLTASDYWNMVVYYAEDVDLNYDEQTRSAGQEVEDDDIVPAGTALYVVVEGDGNYTGQLVSGIYRITEKSITKASVKVTPQYYTGKQIRPGNNDITVKVGGVVLRPGDYTVEGYSNNIKKGKAKLTIRGQRDYGGVKTVSFKIQNRPLAYTVVYAGNGAASGAVKTQVLKNPGVNYTLNANKFKRPGYEFMGWNTKPDGSGEAFADKGDISRSADEVGVVKTMYAMWRPITYTITYDCNVPDGTKTEYTPDDPDYTLPWPNEEDWPESMTFAGWFRDAKLKRGIRVIKEGSYGDLVLHAGWRDL